MQLLGRLGSDNPQVTSSSSARRVSGTDSQKLQEQTLVSHPAGDSDPVNQAGPENWWYFTSQLTGIPLCGMGTVVVLLQVVQNSLKKAIADKTVLFVVLSPCPSHSW